MEVWRHKTITDEKTITWADLSANEQAALKDVSSGKTPPVYSGAEIHAKGLFTLDVDTKTCELTDLGRAVLSQADNSKPETINAAKTVYENEGDPFVCSPEVYKYMDMNERAWPKTLQSYHFEKLKTEGTMTVQRSADVIQEWLDTQADSKPATITAAEFVAGDYAAKIARGECVVAVFDYDTIITSRQWQQVRDVEIIDSASGECWIIHEGRSMDSYSDTKFTVTWQPQPAAAPAEAEAQPAGDVPNPFDESELRSRWLHHRLQERQNGKDGMEFIEYLIWHINARDGKINEMTSSLTATRARLAVVEGALKPFAEIYHDYTTHMIETTWFGNFADYLAEFHGSSELNDYGHAAYEALAANATAEGGE